MNPKVENISETNNVLMFTISNINVSLANSIRRVILADIKTVVFKTSPYEENQCTITANTSRFHNEIIKQRLSCIPIHIHDLDMPLKNYMLEVNVENTTDVKIYVTTENFKIKNVETNTYLSDKDTHDIFPPNNYTGQYIDFLRLRPKLSDEIPGEKIQLTSKFTIGTAKEDGMFNVVSTCSYGKTPDIGKIELESKKKLQEWKDQQMKKQEIDFELRNWKMLDALRITKEDSYDFIIESIGVFTNSELLQKACVNIMERIHFIDQLIDTNELKIERSASTMQNCFDIYLENEDYTIGKIIEYVLYTKYFEGAQILSYCGFKKFHPHDNYSVIRVAYKEPKDASSVVQILKESFKILYIIYNDLHKQFLKLDKKK